MRPHHLGSFSVRIITWEEGKYEPHKLGGKYKPRGQGREVGGWGVGIPLVALEISNFQFCVQNIYSMFKLFFLPFVLSFSLSLFFSFLFSFFIPVFFLSGRLWQSHLFGASAAQKRLSFLFFDTRLLYVCQWPPRLGLLQLLFCLSEISFVLFLSLIWTTRWLQNKEYWFCKIADISASPESQKM